MSEHYNTLSHFQHKHVAFETSDSTSERNMEGNESMIRSKSPSPLNSQSAKPLVLMSERCKLAKGYRQIHEEKSRQQKLMV